MQQPPQDPTGDQQAYYHQQQLWVMMQSAPSPGQQQQHYGGGSQNSGPENEIRSLWIGDLQPWMDEAYIMNIFGQTGEALSAKVIRNKHTGQREGYGFIEFASHAAAQRVLQTYNGTHILNCDQTFRLNWARAGAGERRQAEGSDYTIFVGDLAPDVDDIVLSRMFETLYASFKGAKVVMDRNTGKSKGYGFVRFGDEIEQMLAMREMDGRYCSSRRMRIGPAAYKKQPGMYQDTQGGYLGESYPRNTTVIQSQPDQGPWNGGRYYGYPPQQPQRYESDGNAAPRPQDPNAYYGGGYSGYGNYQQQRQ